MNTCDTCKHWNIHTVAEQDKVRHNSYGLRHYCPLLSTKHNQGAVVTDENDAEAVAHGIGGADIATGPKFGCIHHEPKP